jgi:3-deoxy-7-phosphoheptulonate synthase
LRLPRTVEHCDQAPITGEDCRCRSLRLPRTPARGRAVHGALPGSIRHGLRLLRTPARGRAPRTPRPCISAQVSMLVVMSHNASEGDIGRVVDTIRAMGYDARPIPGMQHTTIGLIGNDASVDSSRLEALPNVLQVIHLAQPYRQVSREWRAANTIIELPNGTRIGGDDVVLMAGPCSVESEEQIMTVARRLRTAGATILRGGAFKPRTSPYAWQGLGLRGLELLAAAREATGMAVVTEALEPDTVAAVAEYADIIQIGARNMQNYPLLRRAGKTGRPILLKRGLSATIRELLLSAEYILAEGNGQVILCERGIRSFDDQTRNLLDLSAIPVVKALSHLPIIADPSHGTGVRAKVIPMARAAVAAGADGLMIEVHPQPDRALSDGAQSLYPEQFEELVGQVDAIADAIGRQLAGRSVRV